MIDTINSQIHDYDHIGWYGRKKVGVILPYTSSKEAKDFFENIMDSFNNVRQESKYTLVTYPPERKSSEKKSEEYLMTG